MIRMAAMSSNVVMERSANLAASAVPVPIMAEFSDHCIRIDRSKLVLITIVLIALIWILALLLEGLTLFFGAFVPNHASRLNALGLFLLGFIPCCGIIGTVLLVKR